ncbi:Y4yA family PLP-dependent enzyme [Methylobacterium sp. E-045]|uniref:Y4yA family PLP-dependent enzyme n=1 Tax=Methylobacterium sp. E-045 TaxID=2836575 RepID=UPI001FBAEB6D|nr:Y4yA family PLP-dependent enzyme [Methylobacterium sp. E-045]MCJ2131712.1 Y4yA family PLP-dependent enzyme [Methylobacterium sp. E-045]
MELKPGSMRAHERAWAVAFRQDAALLDAIAHVAGGPFHIINPESFADNLRAFSKVLRDRRVPGRVYFGKKANKAGAWMREAARQGGSVDVASEPEFAHALANGVRGTDIGVTGAAKSNDLLWLAYRHGAIVAIDALDELERAIAVAEDGAPLRILLRVLPPKATDSRFGLNEDDLGAALRRCAGMRSHLTMEGFSFHLDGYAVEPRAELAAILVERCREVRVGLGLPCSAVSIGGGFACSYVDEDDWRAFQDQADPALFHAGKRFDRFYPYHQSPTGAAMLDAILRTQDRGETLATRMIAADVQLYAEPGRALLDGAGMSVFPVQGFKRNDEHGIVTVAGLSMSLSEQWKNSEFLPSPILVQRGPERPQVPIRAAIGGSSCMEYDVLTWRKVSFPAEPRSGDLMIYVNTAGYQMDKNESEFHQLSLPPKIVVSRRDQQFTWRIDQ